MTKDIITLANPGKDCAPGVEGTKESCYTTKELIVIAEAYNSRHPDNAIPENVITEGNFEKLYNIIDEKLKNCDGDEVCFSKKVGLSDDFVKHIFKPIGPVNNEWLSNIDIANVMEQYEKIYKNFAFYGPCSSDLHLDQVKKIFDIPSSFADMIHGVKLDDPEETKNNKKS